MGERFKELREQNNLTQLEVSKKTGIAVKTIIRLEKNLGNPSLKTMTTLLDVYGYELGIMKKVWKHLFFIKTLDNGL